MKRGSRSRRTSGSTFQLIGGVGAKEAGAFTICVREVSMGNVWENHLSNGAIFGTIL